MSSHEEAIIDMATEAWRFSRQFKRAISKMDAGESGRYINQLIYFQDSLKSKLEGLGIRLENLEGLPYEAGMAAKPLNLEDFSPDDQLFVDQMLEPVIMGEEGLLRTGTIMLKKVSA